MIDNETFKTLSYGVKIAVLGYLAYQLIFNILYTNILWIGEETWVYLTH